MKCQFTATLVPVGEHIRNWNQLSFLSRGKGAVKLAFNTVLTGKAAVAFYVSLSTHATRVGSTRATICERAPSSPGSMAST